MNNILTILILLSTAASFEPRIYEHKRNGRNYFLEIRSDSTFLYERPGMLMGNIHESGKWKVKSNSLILIDSIGTLHSKSAVSGNKIIDQNYISIKVMNERGEALKHLEVSLNDDELIKMTDENGTTRFEFSELKKRRYNQPDSTIETITLKADRWNQSLAVKNIFCNDIMVVKDFNPITTFERRERELKIEGNKLIFPNPSGMNKDQIFEFKRKK